MPIESEEHREYLADSCRTEIYSRALKEVVTSDSIVIDLGAGTGILGMLACRAGAKKVYALDGGDIIELARQIAGANHLSQRIEHLQSLSTEASLPEKASVIVADQIGRFGLECGLWQCFADARKRLLQSGGVCVPATLRLHVALVQAEAEWAAAGFWASHPAGFDFKPAFRWAINTPRPAMLEPRQLLAEAHCGAAIDLQSSDPSAVQIKHVFTAARDGTLHGIAGWFSAQLSPAVEMTNSPLSAERIQRQQLVFLIERPVALRAGDRITLAMTIQPIEDIVSWRVTTTSNNGGEEAFSHSTFLARQISQQELQSLHPESVPELTTVGEARRLVLTLCDGKHTIGQIEQQLLQSFSKLFPSPREAAPFVAETVRRYSRS